MRIAQLWSGSLLVLFAAGCPIWSGDHDDGVCGRFSECDPNPSCVRDSDCGSGEVCGSDNACHAGDCKYWGCPSGDICLSDKDGARCVDGNNNTGGAGGAGGSGGEGGAGGAPGGVYCGTPDDCAPGETCTPNGTCQPGACDTLGCIYGFHCDTANAGGPVCVRDNPAGCGEDADCAPLGADLQCLSGVCTPPADQCFDQTPCASGSVCADGKCTPSCKVDADCPADFGCSDVGLCTEPKEPCTITQDCMSAAQVCVDGACVDRSDGGTCEPGYVWVDNGCIPDQSPSFVCVTDGVQDACAVGSICLHHSCYISCESDPNVCVALPTFDLCKAVTTSSGAHQVCGSDENLGSECDPTAGLICTPGDVCIDGYCK